VLSQFPRPYSKATLVGAQGGILGWLIDRVTRNDPRFCIVVTRDESQARHLEAMLSTLRKDGERTVALLRCLDYQPFGGMSPSRALLMDRATCLFRLLHDPKLRTLIVPSRALLDKVPPVEAFRKHQMTLRVNTTVTLEALIAFLIEGGYNAASVVTDPGSFARRGGLLDVFSPHYPNPVRIDFWGDEIESMRFFDGVTQRTKHTTKELLLGPVHPILMQAETFTRAREEILECADDLGVPTNRVRALTEHLRSMRLGVGMEDLLPAFYPALCTIFDYAPEDTVFILDHPEGWEDKLSEWFEGLEEAQERAAAGRREPVFDTVKLFNRAEEVSNLLNAQTLLRVQAFEPTDGNQAASSSSFSHDALTQTIHASSQKGQHLTDGPLLEALEDWVQDGYRVVLFAHQLGGLERLRLILETHTTIVAEHRTGLKSDEILSLPPGIYLSLGDIGRGFGDVEQRLVLLDETEVFGRKAVQNRSRYAALSGEAFTDWRDMREGDSVVHLFHGIGKYLGLQRNQVDGVETDFLVLEYAGKNRLFVPVDRLHLVSRYRSAENGQPRLDTLGGQRWQRTRGKVKKATRDIAEALLKLHARRKLRSGFAYSALDATFRSFEATFPYEETPDQAQAIDDVMTDMGEARPMDRLLCGDVGFGKTEVALRAAFRAVMDGKQVALVVPTTVLAQQHFLTFKRRFAQWPVAIGSLSRGKKGQEMKETLADIAKGSLDVVVGTHRLLSKDVEFRDLGLLIIDEEHRFGVTHKARIKEFKVDVDVLTMTATPIPRTLHTSMLGLRDLSLIRTPPVDRLAIRTLVARPSDNVIRESIRTELARSGQIYYVHNRVVDIAKHGELVGRLVPEARIGIAHGKLNKSELEKVMLRFVQGDLDVLVCTTIVESGLDVPRANTMLINGAHELGLAQLYQLRGRVGRSSQRASCFLLVPSTVGLSDDARRRVETIQKFVEPGSGFAVASHDMELRGVGDLLGAEQSGNINAVGYDTYLDLLAEAVETLRNSEQQKQKRVDPELKVALETRIPPEWIPDTVLRLRLYRALARARTPQEVGEVYESAIDRFGKAPPQAKRLVELMELKCLAADLGFSAVSFNPKTMAFTLTEHGVLQAELIGEFLNRPMNRFRISPGYQLIRRIESKEWTGELDSLRETLREISNFVSNRRP
jgi:transcription-repair coupling factor (superfamily II helicase)